MLNKYLWQLYLDAGGEKTVKMFEDNFTKGMKKRICRYDNRTAQGLSSFGQYS